MKCTGCGHERLNPLATEADLELQDKIDKALRPRSAECG